MTDTLPAGLREIAGYRFPDLNSPDCQAAAESWSPTFSVRALHRRVLVVAKTRIEGAWSAYIFVVPGQNHDLEWKLWETEGDKLHRNVACAIFPTMAGLPYAS